MTDVNTAQEVVEDVKVEDTVDSPIDECCKVKTVTKDIDVSNGYVSFLLDESKRLSDEVFDLTRLMKNNITKGEPTEKVNSLHSLITEKSKTLDKNKDLLCKCLQFPTDKVDTVVDKEVVEVTGLAEVFNIVRQSINSLSEMLEIASQSNIVDNNSVNS